MTWKDIMKNENIYEDDAREEYQGFVETYNQAKPLIDTLRKKMNTIGNLLNDFNIPEDNTYFSRNPSEELKYDIREALEKLETVDGLNFQELRSNMFYTYELFETGDYNDTSIAEEKFDEMEKMMDEMYWYRW